ncbi:HAMP domain-containing histidine kinase [Fulvivirgaceae bacterium PWU4]|uniref:histidine kinase n=1 Tax=Chryseosolibacter histidini TaxID=2782349 RepID=A0AAP2DJW6_9BACT|nr:HAMP domain-containing sensor histidine kinase [Chryseosolibacter histidini]MBT1697670.1 HAMP domain-containing histidine kinase [Chryseosolibacter histidini]
MKNPLRRITAVFVLIALLPVTFIVYELTSLSENEEIVREIYENQLDAILFSVNQYSDDVMNSWANQISNVLGHTEDTTRLYPLLNRFNAVDFIYFSDLKGRSSVLASGGDRKQAEPVRLAMDGLVAANKDRIDRLVTYQEAGFRKMESIDTLIAGSHVPVLFILDEGSTGVLGVMLVSLPRFIEDMLGPKMQAISQERFVIAAFNERNDSLVYSTVSVDQDTTTVAGMGGALKEAAQKKDLWLLPGYYLTISLVGVTLDDLVNDRLTTTLVILLLLILILAAGIVFLYRNIKRELSLSQAKSEFVSNVSHEIRTPLSLISMYAETLEMNRVTEEKKQEYYSVIARETNRLSRIVNRILNFSQVEANRKTYDFKPLQLNYLCSEVLESYFFQFRDRGFEVEFVKDEDLAVITGDRDSIMEAIVNLIDNAMKYSRDKKHIRIRTIAEIYYSTVEVKDEGIGIAKNHQHEVFEQFYRAPIGDVHNTKGSGLGLTLVKRTMEAHRGKIKLESALGKGSTFRLSFPTKNIRRHES